MALRLTWQNNNIRAVNVEIYRSETPLDRNALPAPVKTITDGSTTWLDSGALFGKTYYYLLATAEGASKVFSTQRKVLVEHARGAGPNKLLWGDERFGYYGLIPAGEFLSLSDILASAKAVAGLPTTAVAPAWHKYVRHNKIIYLADQYLGMARWTDLYSAGLVFGVKGPGPANMIGGVSATDQYCPIAFKGDNYLPRLPRGFWDRYEDLAALQAADNPAISTGIWANFPGQNTMYTNHENIVNPPACEYNDFVYPLHYITPVRQRAPNIADGPLSKYVGGFVYGAPGNNVAGYNQTYNQTRILCQERLIGQTNSITRGLAPWVNGGAGAEPNREAVSIITGAPIAHAYGFRWVPVIELDEHVTINL
jgi:hypothetical protein